MAGFIVTLTFIGFFSLIGALIYWEFKREKQRQAALQQEAEKMGLQFHPDGPASLQSELNSFKLMQTGRRRRMTNVTVGETPDARLAIFDYRFTTGNGKNSKTHYQTVLCMNSSALQMPAFTLRPENFFDSIGNVFGLQDIDFDEHPQFSARFVLKSSEELRTREFFDSELLDFFANRTNIQMEALAGSFLYYRARNRIESEALRGFLEEGYVVFKALRDRLERMG